MMNSKYIDTLLMLIVILSTVRIKWFDITYYKKTLGIKLYHTGIKLVGVRKFTIEYFKENFIKRHSIDFGGDKTIPKWFFCTWRKSAYPCKHFFAIFQKFSAWNWTALSKLYHHSPHLTLSEDQNNEVFNDTSGEDIGDPFSSENFASTYFSENTNKHIAYKGFPQKNSKRKREFGESCRSILNEIRSFTFLLEDNEDLKNVVIKISKGQNEEQPSRRKRSPITKQKKE